MRCISKPILWVSPRALEASEIISVGVKEAVVGNGRKAHVMSLTTKGQ